LTKQVFS